MFGSNSCVLCGYSISDPVCSNCWIKQTEMLLNDLNFSNIDNEYILDKIRNKLPAETLSNTECILCKREDVSLCLYCFSIILKNVLRSFNFSEDSIEEFGYNQMYDEISLQDEKISNLKVGVTT